VEEDARHNIFTSSETVTLAAPDSQPQLMPARSIQRRSSTGTFSKPAARAGIEVSLRSDVEATYNELRNEKGTADWIIFGFGDEVSNVIVPLQKGSNGLPGLVSTLDPNQCAYCYLRLASGVLHSTKFIFIIWAPHQCLPRKRAEISAHKGVVKSVISLFSIELLATETSDLEEDNILIKLQQLGMR